MQAAMGALQGGRVLGFRGLGFKSCLLRKAEAPATQAAMGGLQGCRAQAVGLHQAQAAFHAALQAAG